MSKPLLTAIIDTYNHERFIEQAVVSVLEQDFSAADTEIIVVDDGSTDRTPDLIRKFAPRVRLIRKANGGQASAFNVAIPEAQGEIIAFLDGDDWWVPGKLTAVADVFHKNREVGLVGHAVTQAYLDGRQHTELLREVCRLRIKSPEQARTFRKMKSFLGTSRMTYRREVLGQIGPVPESLTFEADEYLFTLAGLFADVVVLRESYCFYRLHDGNLFQLSNGGENGVRKKQHVLAALAMALEEKLRELRIDRGITKAIVECVQAEADLLRLMVDSGFPWETVSAELRIMRLLHGDASLAQHVFSCARLLPALFMPARTYYRWRHGVSRLEVYKALRKRFFPFPVPSHVEREERPAPRASSRV
jgi:glycosyltransferase involved in cell wall biosynthesis